MLKLKKVGKTTRPIRYDLNQIPYDYTVEVTKRFKGLDLVNKELNNYGQSFIILCRRQWAKPSQRKINEKKAKCLSRLYKVVVWGKKRIESKGERERYTQLNAEFERNARSEEKAFFNEQCKETEENKRMERLENSSRKLDISKEHFIQRTHFIKDTNCMDLTEAEVI